MMLSDLDSAWYLAIIQMAGLVMAIASRFHQGTCWQNLCHRLFLGCLGLSGLSTFHAWTIGPGYCTVCGATLAVSVLTAVWEVRGSMAHAH